MAARELEAQTRRHGTAAVVDLRGEINAQGEQTLESAFNAARELAVDTIALNFSQVDYINSAGLGLIASLLAYAQRAGQRMSVFGLDEHYAELFSITRLSDFVIVAPDEAAAVAPAAPAAVPEVEAPPSGSSETVSRP